MRGRGKARRAVSRGSALGRMVSRQTDSESRGDGRYTVSTRRGLSSGIGAGDGEGYGYVGGYGYGAGAAVAGGR